MEVVSIRRASDSVRLYAAFCILVVIIAYAPEVGTGFVKEDASWIITSRIDSLSDVGRMFTVTGGFFRPVVALSFGLNFWMFGANPLGYGWTNLLLAIAVAIGIARFAMTLELPKGASVLAGAVWILNFHGVNMAVLWLSGRTALLLTLFAVLAATAAVRDRPVACAIWTFLAMASKEEAVLLPIALFAILWLRPQGLPGKKRTLAFAVALIAVWILYGGLRIRSDAFTPLNAPAFYTFAANDWSFARNVTEYSDRVLTLSAATALLSLIVGARRPSLQRVDARLIALGAVWIANALALTVLLPTRSSLYALFPSVGATIVCAVVVNAVWKEMTSTRRIAGSILAVVLPLCFVPVYWQRNTRWTELSHLSARVLTTIREATPATGSRPKVVVVDDVSRRANVTAAIGGNLPDAIELTSGVRPYVWLIPPPSDMLSQDWSTAPAVPDVVIALRQTDVVRLSLNEWQPAPAAALH